MGSSRTRVQFGQARIRRKHFRNLAADFAHVLVQLPNVPQQFAALFGHDSFARASFAHLVLTRVIPRLFYNTYRIS